MAVCLWKIREKGKVVGRVGGGVGTGKSTRKLCRNDALANYPLASPLRPFNCNRTLKGRQTGGGSNGGVSRSGLVLPFLSFLVLCGTFPIFPGFSRFVRGWSGDFLDSSLFSFSAY